MDEERMIKDVLENLVVDVFDMIHAKDKRILDNETENTTNDILELSDILNDKFN